MPTLVIATPSGQRGTFELGPGITLVGREESCSLVLPDPSVSRQHARLVCEEGTVTVEDLDSRNGVVVDGRNLATHRMEPNQTVKLGRFGILLLGPNQASLMGHAITDLPVYDPKQA